VFAPDGVGVGLTDVRGAGMAVVEGVVTDAAFCALVNTFGSPSPYAERLSQVS
jgi:hypothetical protein